MNVGESFLDLVIANWSLGEAKRRDGAWGMGHWANRALGMGHWALGIGHWSLGICAFFTVCFEFLAITVLDAQTLYVVDKQCTL
ncbi:hypothetical protein [Microcoleus sp. bin38.metabat.b11b12b14.051]|uniref:hypothetical protein n=1 Tax=Microcoleus sp. bin38.metabat.b11b12b14.051 TaxID=2742709 RepID=UPI0025FE2AA0|nr:hypothetical protein [Microcoleus sp. bin38.metabat.b11b12b14.051]